MTNIPGARLTRPILLEGPNFPGMQRWPKSFVLKDEIYQMKDYSRGRVRVLIRLNASKLDLNDARVNRKDLDFAVIWAMYAKGRVYYSTLGHVEQTWADPRIQEMDYGPHRCRCNLETGCRPIRQQALGRTNRWYRVDLKVALREHGNGG